MRLTEKQEKFAKEVAAGRTLSDAYRVAYNSENMLDTTIWQESSKLMDNPKVAERVKQLLDHREKAFLQADAKRIRVHVIDRLLAESTSEKNRGGERIKALELLGKLDVVGMFKEKTEVEHKGETDIGLLEAQLRAKLEQYLGASAIDITPSGGPGITDNRSASED